MLGFLAEEGGAAAWFRAAWGEFCLDFWPQKVAQQYGSEQLWGEFCLDFWPKKVAQRHGLGQLWSEFCLDFLVQR